MYPRPGSVTAVGYLLTLGGVLAILRSIFYLNLLDDPRYEQLKPADSLPTSVGVGLGALGAIIATVAGINVLRGENWARWLYAIWCVVSLVLGLFFATNLGALVPIFVIQSVIIFCLFLPDSNRFFRRPFCG